MRLVDLFGTASLAANENRHALADALVLAPRRLEPRRLLDAGAAGLALQWLDAGDSVQAGPDSTSLADSAEGPAAVMPNTPPANLEIAPIIDVDEGGVATLELAFEDPDIGDTHTVEVDWGDGSPLESFTVPTGSQFFGTTHQYVDDPAGTVDVPFTVNVRVVDAAGDDVTGTATATVDNLAPEVTEVASPAPIDENGVAQLELAFTDPGLLDTHTVEIYWGDGSPIETFNVDPGSQFFSTSHQYLDDNPSGTPTDHYAIAFRVVDDDGGASPWQTTTATVNNVAPAIVDVAPVATIDENQVATLELEFADPGTLDSHDVEVDWGDGSPLETFTVSAGARFFSTTHQYLDDNAADAYTITVRVRDDDGGVSAPAMVVAPVQNVAPTIISLGSTQLLFENGVATLELQFGDPGRLDPHEVEIDWGDGSPVETLTVAAGARFLTTTHQYLDDNPSGTPVDQYTITIRVRDDDGGVSAPLMRPITVFNVQPTVTTIAPVATIDENQFATLEFEFSDPGTLDEHEAVIDWGDGSPVETFTISAGARFFSTTHQYLDDNPSGTSSDAFTITVRVRDDDTGLSQPILAQVTVKNVPPFNVAVVPATSTADEGSLVTLDVAFDDPGTLDTHTYEVDWGDGSTSTGAATGHAILATHTYADDGLYSVTVRVTDDDGGMADAVASIQINNVAPTLTVALDQAVDEGTLLSIANIGVFTDPGFDNALNPGVEIEESFRYEIDWGDGSSVPETSIGDLNGGPGTPSSSAFGGSHIYADNGTYTVTVAVRDDDGGVAVRTFTVTVNNVAPTLTLPPLGPFTLSESQTLFLPPLGSFTDPGFDNPANTGDPSNGGETTETFTYTIDWDDGTVETFTPVVTPGGPGIPSAGLLAGHSHQYLDNDADNIYTVTVTVSDDDGGSHSQSFNITVWNVNPTLDPITATDVDAFGRTTLTLSFSDPGADTFDILVDWGDGVFVKEEFHDGPTPKTFVIAHTYFAPPDPANPAADITIHVKVQDDDFKTAGVVAPGESNEEETVITNPGANDRFVRIDTSPKVPILTFNVRPAAVFVPISALQAPATDDSGEIEGSAGEAASTGEQHLELVLINPDESIAGRTQLPFEAIHNLPALFRNLPDGHYRIYLVQAETEVRRLVIEVFVRDGRLIDPSDDSEGARDRPPGDDQPAGDDPAAVENTDASDASASLPASLPLGVGNGASRAALLNDADAWPTPARLRHGPLVASVALALSAAGKSWREQVDQSLAKAQTEKRKKLQSIGNWRGPRKPR
jgi:hypothetical protein